MEDIDYTIGDDIVCIQTHTGGIVKEGEVYIAKDIRPSNCKCCSQMVDVGKREIERYTVLNGGLVLCSSCGTIYEEDGIFWIDATMFKKLDNLVNIGELLEVLEEPVLNQI